MTTALQTTQQQLDEKTMLALVGNGNTADLSPTQKIAYYNARCEAAGLDPRTQPFQFVKLQGGEKLYATKTATDQLSTVHKLRTEILSQKTEHGVREVTVRVTAADGRSTEEIGVVPVDGLKGEALANAMMKAVTKAKRRAVLSVCGLGMLDETEVETIPGAKPAPLRFGEPLDVVPHDPPAYTRAQLWNATVAKFGENAAAEFGEAIERAGIDKTVRSDKWVQAQIDLVAKELVDAGVAL